MENLNRYFSDAEENISNEYMSANGEYSDWDDAFDFGGSEEEYLNAMGSADASSSQPYIISLYNSTAADVASVEIGGAYNTITKVTAIAAGGGIPAGEAGNTAGYPKYNMAISGVTYLEFLWQSSSKPFVVGLTYLQSDGGSTSGS